MVCAYEAVGQRIACLTRCFPLSALSGEREAKLSRGLLYMGHTRQVEAEAETANLRSDIPRLTIQTARLLLGVMGGHLMAIGASGGPAAIERHRAEWQTAFTAAPLAVALRLAARLQGIHRRDEPPPFVRVFANATVAAVWAAVQVRVLCCALPAACLFVPNPNRLHECRWFQV